MTEANELAHTDHPSRHWDRTCPGCLQEAASQTPYILSEVEKKALDRALAKSVQFVDSFDAPTVVGYRWRFRGGADRTWRYCEGDPRADGLICEVQALCLAP